MYNVNTSSWDFKKPPSVCPQDTTLKQLKKSYTGYRPNLTLMSMPVIPTHEKHKKFHNIYRNIGPEIKIPDNFSWRDIGADQIENSKLRNGIDARDQERCGGCWAFSIASVLGDRISLKYGLKSPYLSTSWLISNSPNIIPDQPGCSGNNVFEALKYLGNINGIPLQSCWSYDIITESQKYGGPSYNDTDLMVAPNPLNSKDLENCCYNCCNTSIQDKSGLFLGCKVYQENNIFNTNYFGITSNILKDGSYPIDDINNLVKSIQQEILVNGPVTTSIFVFNDFMTYWKNDAPDKKIYERDADVSNKLDGGHAVVITGWGVDNNGKKYWEIRNSWGNTGDHGYGRIAFSDPNNTDTWIGIDIPLYMNNSYIGGVISLEPKDIPNLQELLDKKLLFKSDYGTFSIKNGVPTSVYSSTSVNLYLIIGLILFIIIICIILYYYLGKSNVPIQPKKNDSIY